MEEFKQDSLQIHLYKSLLQNLNLTAMTTIQAAKKCDMNLKLSRVQYEMIVKILCAAQNSFVEGDQNDKENGYEYVDNGGFICSLSKEEYEALQDIIK